MNGRSLKPTSVTHSEKVVLLNAESTVEEEVTVPVSVIQFENEQPLLPESNEIILLSESQWHNDFQTIGDDTIQKVFSFFKRSDSINVSIANKAFRKNATNPKLINAAKINEKIFEDVNKLLLHFAHGEKTEAKDMIEANPELLFHRGNVTDYSGRTFNNILPIELNTLYDAYDLGTMAVNACLGEKRHLLKEQHDNFLSGGWKQWKHLLNDPESKEEEYISIHRQITNKLSSLLQTYIQKFETVEEDPTDAWWNERSKDCLEFGRLERAMPVETAQLILRPRRQDGTVDRQLTLENGHAFSWFPLSENSGIGFDRFLFFSRRWHLVLLIEGSPSKLFNAKEMADLLAVVCGDRAERAEEFKALLNALPVPSPRFLP